MIGIHLNPKGRLVLKLENTDEVAVMEKVRQIEWRKWETLQGHFTFPLHCFRELVGKLREVPDPDKYWDEKVDAAILAREEREAELLRIKNTWDYPRWDFEDSIPIKPPRTEQGFAPFQRQGIVHAITAKTSGIFDDPGMGKTLQVGGALKLLQRQGIGKRALVVTLNSAKRQFATELRSTFNLDARSVRGEKKAREAIYAGDQYVTVTSYHLLSYDAKFLRELHKKRPFQIMVLDEGQRIKDWNGVWAELARSISATIPYRWVTTASPLENKVEELMSLMLWASPDILGSKVEVEEMFVLHDIYGNVSGYQRLDEFRRLIDPYYVQRFKKDHLADLKDAPPEPNWVTLKKEQRSFYRKVLAKTVEDLEDTTKQQRINAADPFAQYAYLRQALESSELIDNTQQDSAKLDELKLILQRMPQGDKAIVYTPFERMTSILERELAEYHPIRYHGGLSDTCRRKTEECDTGCQWFADGCRARSRERVKFDTDPDCRVFITDDAGKEALNIQSANWVICFGVPWNPKALEQLVGRANRWGQSKAVYFILLLALNTLDEYIYETVLTKDQLFRAIFQLGDQKGKSLEQFIFDEIRSNIRERLKAEQRQAIDD